MLPITNLTRDEARRVRTVLTDIDDTLTNDGKLPAEAYSALLRLREAGKMPPAELPRELGDDGDFAALLADGNRRQQIAEALAGCLERLPETQRQSIRLFFFDDCSYADIAAATSWHLKSIRSYIQNGKRNLKNCLRNKLP